MEEEFLLDLLLKDLGRDGHSRLSQHYAGLAFDAGQNLSASRKGKYEKFSFNFWYLELRGTSEFDAELGTF